MKVFLIVSFVFLCSVNVCAVPAYPRKVSVPTSNGKWVTIYMRGDEYQKFAVSEDGYTLLCDSVGWWYATISDDGKVGKSSYRLMAEEDEDMDIKNFKENCPKGIVPERLQMKNSDVIAKTRNSVPNEPVIGERRSLVILMQYRDLPFSKTKEDFEDLFNSENYYENGAEGSVRDFYQFASQGQLDYISDIYGPFTSRYSMRYYGENESYGGGDSRPLELCVEAIENLPSDIDYSLYDNNDDGLVDNVHIIFAGYGEEAGGTSDAIWSHEYPHTIYLKNQIGYSLASYSCSPELRGNMGTRITNIGVICHELGHALGAMDYYDTDYENGGGYLGTGEWDIMADGSWNDDGRMPANFNPHVRSSVFKWNEQVTLASNQNVVMPRMEMDNAKQSIVYRIDTECEGDYFLLENRQKYGFDAALPGEGLMIYHVHPDIDKLSSSNKINSTHPQAFYPVCASGSDPHNGEYGDINSTGTPFPGNANVRTFSSVTYPSAVAWDGESANVALSDIAIDFSDGSISFVTGGTTVEPDEPDDSIVNKIVYQESFETKTDDRITASSIAGKEMWRRYKVGGLAMDAELIPEAKDGKCIFMLFLGKKNAITKSEAVGPEIDVVAGRNYVLTFDINSYCLPNSKINSQFKLFIEDEYGEKLVYSSDNIENEWKTVTIPLVFASNRFHYRLYGSLLSGGIFIDNIRLHEEETVEGIGVNNSSFNEKNEVYVFRLDGTFIGHKEISELDNLPSGVYILRNKNGVRKMVR